MSTKQIEQTARKLCTHTVVFTSIEQQLVAVRAMQGQSTKAIANEMGISESQAQYRIQKAQNSLNARFRANYRNGESEFAKKMLKATQAIGIKIVRDQIAPKFIQFAATGVPRTP